jgi:branched-chain amino acid transport system substrate-binding protein
VRAEEFTDKDTDMTAQLTNIKNTGADAVICWGIGPAPALIAKQMNQLNLDIPVIRATAWRTSASSRPQGISAEGVILPAGKLLVAEQLPDDDPQKELLVTYAAAV